MQLGESAIGYGLQLRSQKSFHRFRDLARRTAHPLLLALHLAVAPPLGRYLLHIRQAHIEPLSQFQKRALPTVMRREDLAS